MKGKPDRKLFGISVGMIFNIIIIGVTIFLVVYFVFSEDGLVDLLSSGLEISVWWIVAAVCLHLLNISIDATVIYLFLRQNVPDLKVKTALTASMVGQFYCAVTPSATGGQPMQVLMMTRAGIKGSVTTSALVQKFLVWQFTLAVYFIVAVVARFSFFRENLDTHMWAAQMIMLGILLLASFAKNFTYKTVSGIFKLLGKMRILKNVDNKIKSLEDILTSFNESNRCLIKNKPLLIKAYILTAIQMTALFLVPYFIAMSFHIPDLNIFDMLCAQSYVNMVSSLVPLPGGSGAAEYCFSTFFMTYISADTMKTSILLWRTITYYGTIMISLPFSSIKKKAVTAEVTDEKDIEAE